MDQISDTPEDANGDKKDRPGIPCVKCRDGDWEDKRPCTACGGVGRYPGVTYQQGERIIELLEEIGTILWNSA